MQRVTRSKKYTSIVLGGLFAATMALGACGEVAEEEPAVEEDPAMEEQEGLEEDPMMEDEDPVMEDDAMDEGEMEEGLGDDADDEGSY